MAVGVLVGIITIMVTLSAAVPYLRPDLELSPDKEKPHGKTVCIACCVYHTVSIEFLHIG